MTADESGTPQRLATRPTPDPRATRRARRSVATAAVALALASVAYRVIMSTGLDQTAALFIGLPAMLAIAVAFSPPAKTVTGLIIKTMTLGLLLGGTLVGETLVCLLTSAPLVYLIGFAVGAPIDAARRRRAQGRSAGAPLMVVGLVVLAGFEGVVPGVEAGTSGSVTAVGHVAAAPSAVAAALAAPPRFDASLPLPLRVGFPRPVHATGGGLDLGDRRQVTFVGDGHHGTTHVGELELEVVASDPGRVSFATVADDTRVAQWLRWQRADVTWSAEGSGTRVVWTLTFDRQLAPSWYFSPVQHAAAHLAAGYLIQTVATPGG